jgi:hypothetical protein
LIKKLFAACAAILAAGILAGCASTYVYDKSVPAGECATLIIDVAWDSGYQLYVTKMDGEPVPDSLLGWGKGDTILIPAGEHTLEWHTYTTRNSGGSGERRPGKPLTWYFEAGKTYGFTGSTLTEIRPD